MPGIAEIMQTMDYGPSPEADEAARAWLKRHEAGFGHFIDGKFTKPGEPFEVIEPARGGVIARASQGTEADIAAAVAAARRACKDWSALAGYERARHLYALARLVQKRERFFSVLETIDTGKPLRESRDIDLPLVARHFYHHAGWASLIESEFPGAKPVGVCGAIIPWNFPLLRLAGKVAPALACGATAVLKPAGETPLSALAFAELCVEAGLPPGVVNIVTGDERTGEALATHEGVDRIAFTGSTEVGRLIHKATAGSSKRLALELGGKSPLIVFDDADLDSAIEGVVDAIWFNQGEVGSAGSRLLVAEAVADKFLRRLKSRMERLIVGDPLDKSTDIGAIVSAAQVKRIADFVEAGRAEGFSIYQPSRAPPPGLYFPPTLIEGVAPASRLAQEDIFGPVLVAMTFRTPDEAIALANNTRYGLAASVWSENINRAFEVAAKLKAGVVWINAANVFDAGAGFGGKRESGYGREGGREGLYEYLVTDALPRAKPGAAKAVKPSAAPGPAPAAAGLDRTPKLYIGGRQARPDSGASYSVLDPKGRSLGQAGLGGRKDIRNAVEAASKAGGWAAASAHNRAQVIYYIAENLSARAAEFAERIRAMTGASAREAADEVESALRRLFFYAGFADKFDGAVHAAKARFVTLAIHEPFGVMGLVSPDEAPLLALVSLVAPAIAMGNAVVVVPSSAHPLAATDFYSVLDTSDAPAGVVNIVTGETAALAKTLAEHDGVEALWHCGGRDLARALETASAGNLKSTWDLGENVDWRAAEGRAFLSRATHVKTIWTPYGE